MASSDAAPDDFERHVRRVDPDRWLAARLIEEPAARTEVLALYALDHELGRIAPAVSQPMLGEIRLQWWREAIARAGEGGAADHPVIAALKPALQAGRLRRDLLESLLSSHAIDLEPQPFADEAGLLAWMDARFGAAMGLAARLLDPAADDGDAFVHAGRAWGWSSLLQAAPAWRAQGRDPWPARWEGVDEVAARVRVRVDAALKASRAGLKGLPTAAFPAVAYTTLARDYARGRAPSDLVKRAKLLWASAKGAL